MDILEQIPSDKLDKRTLVCFNAVLFSFDQIVGRYLELQRLCVLRDPCHRAAIVSIAWDIVDWCERLRKILAVASGIKKHEPWFRLLTQDLEPIEQVRHFIQHYDGQIGELMSGCKPTLGFVTALYPIRNDEFSASTFIPGTHRVGPGEEMSLFNVRIPKEIYFPVDHVTLHIGDHRVNLSEVYRRVASAAQDMKETIRKKYIEPNQAREATATAGMSAAGQPPRQS